MPWFSQEAPSISRDQIRALAQRINREHRISERVSNTARRAVDAVDEALDDAGVKKKAGEVVDSAGAAAKVAGSRAAEGSVQDH